MNRDVRTPADSQGLVGRIGELLTGAAYRPRICDATVSLPERLRGRNVVVLAVARDRAATLSVRFERDSVVRTSESRQHLVRQKGDLSRILAAAATGAEWLVVVMTVGWHAQLSTRAARQASAPAFERFRLMSEQPDVLVGQPRHDMIYTSVDHPVLDRAVVFSCRRKDVDDVLAESAEAGLRVAAVRLAVASQLERWFARERERALDRDLLVSDGMSVLLLNAWDGDLFSSGREGDLVPRQASARPTEVPHDIARLAEANGTRPLRFLGPSELLESSGLARAPEGAVSPCTSDTLVNDGVMAALSSEVFHDLNPQLVAERPALSPRWRPWVWTCLGVVAATLLLLGGAAWTGISAGLGADAAVRGRLVAESGVEEARRELARLAAKAGEAERVRAWVLCNFHAQPLVARLLQSLPPPVALDSLQVTLDEESPQMSLEFLLVGGEEAQVSALRALEHTVLELGFQIGERLPPASGPRGRSYRWRLLMPVVGGKEGTP